jgi:pimeloyl-ACP methyl ester carboxylesterase
MPAAPASASPTMDANELELSSGTIEYADSGEGPAIVFLHGLLMDGSLWDGVIDALSPEHRCVAPTLPLGAHRRPMNEEADLSISGVAKLVEELLERLDLHEVTVVGTDTGGAVLQLMMRDANAQHRVRQRPQASRSLSRARGDVAAHRAGSRGRAPGRVGK